MSIYLFFNHIEYSCCVLKIQLKKKVGKLVKRKKERKKERKKLMGNDDVGMDSFLPKKKKELL